MSPDITSPQFAVLYALRAETDIDQRTLGRRVSLDRSTTTEVVTRLAARRLVQRLRDVHDRRRNLIRLTPRGEQMLKALVPRAIRMNRILVSALSPRERAELLRFLNVLVDADESLKKQRQTANGEIRRATAG